MPDTKKRSRPYPAALLLLAVLLPASAASAADQFPPESVYDTTVHPDEALVNVRIRNHRWPDCYSLETAIADIFRLEGVADAPDATEAKAMATWRWLMTLMSISGGRIFEGNPTGKWVRCHGDKDVQQIEIRRGDKLLHVYGVHECGGLSRVLVHLWRAAGYLGYQEPSSGHSVACLRYPDRDGIWRMHSFNPQGSSYYWNPRDKRVGTRRRPVMRGVEYKRLLPPMEHTLRTSLRLGETVTRKWSNDGYIQMTQRMGYWKKRPKHKQIHAHCVAGQEDQVLVADTRFETFHDQLWKPSKNVACSPPAEGKARLLHPAKAGQTAEFIYRLASPYVAIEAEIEATLVKTVESDVCRLAFSNNMGKTWHVFYDKKDLGEGAMKVSIGRKRYWKPAPSITSHYTFLIKAEFRTDGKPRQVGMNALKITVHRQLNYRALPNLMPGENVIKVSADSLRAGLALRLDLDYEVNGKAMSVRRVIRKFPHHFRVDVTGLPAEKLNGKHYLAEWGGTYTFNLPTHPLRMKSVKLRLVPSASAEATPSALPAEQAEAFFNKPYPTPYKRDRKMINEKKIPKYESEVSGFFPQVPRTQEHPTDPLAYYHWLIANVGTSDAKLPKLSEGTDPIDWCIKKLPRAHGGHTTGICNVLAHFADKRAVPALLAKWKQAPKYGPGDRYIPDALAAIGDRSVVPALVKRVKQLRIDYRIHVARALGILGGTEAEKTLKFLAEKDPNISVRGQARRTLAKMAADGRGEAPAARQPASVLKPAGEGWVKLFNGKDLTGWKGLVGSPKSRAKMRPEQLAAAQKRADANMRAHWEVAGGALAFDGKGHSLCTAKDYVDFELLVDSKIGKGGDSGIYLRGSPQVQIWDRKEGSGGLYNNRKHPRKPLLAADKPPGQWNTFYIRMVGERVTVYLNGRLVVDNVVMENYWERGKPIYPTGQIELQSHGSKLYFRNIHIRELPLKRSESGRTGHVQCEGHGVTAES